jgi:hypothetical protein
VFAGSAKSVGDVANSMMRNKRRITEGKPLQNAIFQILPEEIWLRFCGNDVDIFGIVFLSIHKPATGTTRLPLPN